jgi:hypothetical protein
MAVLRNAYNSEESALRVLGCGLVQAVMNIADAKGFKAVAFPFEGAFFGMVATVSGPAMALFHGGKWLVKTDKGVAVLPLRLGFLAWRIT